MSRKILIALGLWLSLIGFGHAQCGTTFSKEESNYIRSSLNSYNLNPSMMVATSSVRFIAIKPYIFRAADGSGSPEIEKLEEELNYTNTLFAPSNIQFYFLSYEIIDGSAYYDFDQTSEQDALFTNHGLANTINAYFVSHIERTDGSDVCGYAYSNSSEGIVSTIIENDCVNGDVLGITLPHELGHLMTLYHTHGKTNLGTTDELVDGSNCTTAGDEICDTPADPNLRGVQDRDCSYTGTAVDANGDSYSPLLDNVMSYGRNKCQDNFTAGQFSRIADASTAVRSALQDSVATSFASFRVDDRTLIFSGDEVQFTDQSLDAVSWSWTFEGGTPASSTDQNPAVTYTNAGQYDVTLTIIDSNGDDATFTFENYLSVNPIDITYFTPEEWDAPVRFYKFDSDGSTKIYQDEFTAGDDIYLEYGITNLGVNDAVDSVLSVKIYANDVRKWTNTWTISAQGELIGTTPRIGLLPPGENQIRIEYDADDDYPEFDEDNNTYTTTLTVSEPEGIDPSPVSPVVGIEYFFDTIVGFGQGIFISASNTTMDETIETNIPVNSLSNGLHALYVRALNQAGRWGQTHKRNVYVVPSEDLSINQSEYYFDQDPGFGSATPITLTDGESSHVIDLSDLSNGYHRLFIRTQNNMGRWSVTNNISFVKVGQKLNPEINKLTYRYYDYETESYGTEYTYTFDPSVAASEEVLFLDNSELESGKEYAVVVYAYNENGKRSRLTFENFTYNEVVLISIDDVEVTEVACHGTNTGQLSISASGGSGQLEYSINGTDYQTESIFDSLAAGDYTVYVKGDNENYVETAEVTISEPDELVLSSIDLVNPSCLTTRDGQVILSVSGGTSPYQFGLNDQLQDSNTFTDLSIGDKEFKVLDANGCEALVSVQLNLQEQLDTPLIQIIDSTGLSVSSQFDSYQWMLNGESIAGETDSTFSVTDYGSYHVQVTSTQGCTYVSDTVTVEQLVVDEVKVIGVSCTGSMDGAIRVSASGGYGDLSYSLDGETYQTNQRFYELPEGEHTLYIRSGLINYVQQQVYTIEVASEIELFNETFDQRDPHKLINPDDDITWSVTNLAQFDGEFSFLMNFWNYTSLGARDYYVLPGSVMAQDRKQLGFKYAYSGYSGAPSATDSLAIAQSFDCGETWNIIQQWGGEELQTTAPKEDYFVPTGSEWDSLSIRLDTSSSDYLLAFIGINQYGNLLYIDNIDLENYENQSPAIDIVDFSIEENSPVGSVVGTVTASDGDGDEVAFELLSGDLDEIFTLDAHSGEITVNNTALLDYETIQQIDLEIRVSDNYGGADTSIVAVEIIDVNENATPIINNQTFTVNENSPSGTLVGSIEAADPDEDVLSYSVLSGNTSDAFALNSSTGELSVQTSEALDFETTSSFSLVVEVNDGNGESAFGTITVNLENVDETELNEATYSIAESVSSGTVLGAVGYFENGTDQFPYFITDQIDQNDPAQVRGVEVINSGGIEFSSTNYDLIITDSEVLDYESFSEFKLVVALCCYTTGEEPTAVISVQVTNVNEETTMADQNFSIQENSANGTLVGTILAADEDDDPLAFAIISGNTGDAFSLNGATGELIVQNSEVLDFETNPSFNLEVQVDDGNGATASATITVALIDEKENVLAEVPLEQFIAYPNPTSRLVQVDVHPKLIGDQMRLFNLSGKIVKTWDVLSASYSIDLTEFPEGVYLLKIKDQSIRLVKQ